MGLLSSLIVSIGAETSSFDRAMNAAINKTRRFGADMASIGSSLTLGLTAPLVGAGIAATKSAADIDALTRGLTAVMGSAEKAGRELVVLREVAKMPGLGFKEAIAGSVNLQAAGFSADLAKRSLMAFGNALATVGKGKAELDGVSTALTQIMAKGKVSAEEINQLQERLPQIRQAMKDAFGTADTEVLQKMGMSSQQFIEGIIAQFEKLPPVTGGIKNDIENFQDSFQIAMAKSGEALIPFASKFLEFGTSFAGKLQGLSQWFVDLPPNVQTLAVAIGGLAAAIGPATWAVGSLITNFATISKFMGPGGLIGMFTTLNPLTIAFGVAIAAWALGTAIAELSRVNTELDRLYALQVRGVQASKDQANEIRILEGIARAHRVAVESEGLSIEQYIAALRKAVGGLKEYQGWTQAVETAQQNAAVSTKGIVIDLSKGVDAFTATAAAAKGASLAVASAGSAAAASVEPVQTALVNWRGLAETLRDIESSKAGQKLQDDWLKIMSATRDRNAVFTFPVELEPPDTSEIKRATNPTMEDLKKVIDSQLPAVGAAVNDVQNKITPLGREVRRVFDEMSRGIARSIVDWKGLGETAKGICKSIAESILEYAIKRGIGALITSLDGVTSKMGAIGKEMANWAKSISGTASSAVGSAGNAAGGAAGAAGNAGSSAASAVASGAMGWVGAISGAVSAVSSVIGNFQMAHQETSLNAIEHNTRYSMMYLGERADGGILGQIFKTNELLGWGPGVKVLEKIHDYLVGNGVGLKGGGGTVNITINEVSDAKETAKAVAQELKLAGAFGF